MNFAKSLNFMGVRLATNQDLLFRDEQLQGSGIQIFLKQRALVEIYKEKESSGNVLYSRMLDFGTVEIDTRNFPQGSYDIEIVVRDGSAVISRETRPFIKTQDLPPRGKPILSFEAGEIRKDLNVEGIPVVESTYRVRLADGLGGSIGTAATSQDHITELSLSHRKELHFFSYRWIATNFAYRGIRRNIEAKTCGS